MIKRCERAKFAAGALDTSRRILDICRHHQGKEIPLAATRSTRKTMPLAGNVRGIGKGRLRLGPLMAIPAVLAEFGVDPFPVLVECGLTPAAFDNGENTISFRDGAGLLRMCVERTRCEHFGLLVGERATAQSMGALGYLMLSSTTVGVALDALAVHLSASDRGSIASTRVEGDVAVLSYAILEPGELERTDQIYAVSLAVGSGIMRGLCGQQWRPERVTFTFPRPRDVVPYRRFFGVTPDFNYAESALLFPARQLDAPLVGADQVLNRLMQERVSTHSYAAGDDLVENVRRLLRASLHTTNNSLAKVASNLGVHERTLERMLIKRSTSFRLEREKLWQEIACELLSGTGIPVGEIAASLGYSEPGAFTRAFVRWTGSTPLVWRNAHRQAS